MHAPERVNYDAVAPTYDRRYAAGAPAGIAATLLSMARTVRAQRVLEVGCGTGHWLEVLRSAVPQVYGLDRSSGMLRQARARRADFHLIYGEANQLPCRAASFELIACVNALHHFADPGAFVRESLTLLRPGGALVVIGMDPKAGRDRWYLYDYFPGTHDTDRARYPSAGAVVDWMMAAGFVEAQTAVAARIRDTRSGRAVFDDPILHRHGTSQLSLLSDDAYAAGMQRITDAVTRGETAGTALSFSIDVSLALIVGRVAAAE